MRSTIGAKIFSIAIALLILMGAAAALGLRMTHTLDGQLVVIDHNYFPAVTALADANIDTLREATLFRRQLLDLSSGESVNDPDVAGLQRRIEQAGQESNKSLVAARKSINEQITDELDFDDNVALARLDTQVEFLQEARRDYEDVIGQIRA